MNKISRQLIKIAREIKTSYGNISCEFISDDISRKQEQNIIFNIFK